MDIQGWLADVEDLSLPKESLPAKSKRRHQREKPPHAPPGRRSPSCHSPRPTSSTITSSQSSSSTSSGVAAPEETFERRKRHRTRVDLYEPNSGVRSKRSKRKVQDAEQGDDIGKTKKKSKRKSKHERRPGEELVKSFRTSKVNKDRITVSLFSTTGSVEDC